MTVSRRGDVVLVDFVFPDESGTKRRPVLVVSSEAYHQGRQEAIVAAITSNASRLLPGDHLVADWKSAGLLWPSVITGILRTVKQGMIQRTLGSLPHLDMQGYEDALSRSLGLR